MPAAERAQDRRGAHRVSTLRRRRPGRTGSWGWSQMWSHSPQSGTVHRRPRAAHPRRSRTSAATGERRSALLESVLGATPREFESRILRHADLRRCEHGAGGQYPPGVLARSQIWSQLRASARTVSGISSRCCAWSRTPRMGLNICQHAAEACARRTAVPRMTARYVHRI